jgi:hypothetical protein
MVDCYKEESRDLSLDQNMRPLVSNAVGIASSLPEIKGGLLAIRFP